MSGSIASCSCSGTVMHLGGAWTVLRHIQNVQPPDGISKGRSSELTTNVHSLHATAYPWVHEQWFKTFDHQAYV